MSHPIIFMLIFAIIAIHKAQSECDPTMCTNDCQNKGMSAGNCNGDSCDCSFGKKCSEMVKLTCKIACKEKDLVGMCLQNDLCFCRASIKLCAPTECTQQCLDDPRAKECQAAGGFVTPIACAKYGDVKTCGCLCTLPLTNSQLNSDHDLSSELFRYNVTSQ